MKEREGFVFEIEGGVIKVWLGPSNDPESDIILSVHESYIPALIATLRAAQAPRKSNKEKTARHK